MEMKNWDTVWQEEKIYRKNIDPKRICTFGVQALDDCLIGILKDDLVVIGADSGSGKSDIALNMALHNSLNGKKVGLYFLEGGARSAITRIKWKYIKDKYYREGNRGIDIDYRKWRMNFPETNKLEDIETSCMEELKQKIGNNLEIYSFNEGFKINNLMDSLGWFRNYKPGEFLMEEYLDIDLIIIDHLQYFDMTNPKNEFLEMGNILKKVKSITDHHNVPVVLISHLRKREKDRGIPGQEDFHGTSNIAKIASIAITVSPCSEKYDHGAGVYPTYLRICKERSSPAGFSYAMLCDYLGIRGQYAKEYELYRLVRDNPDKVLDYNNLPKWAREGGNVRKLKSIEKIMERTESWTESTS